MEYYPPEVTKTSNLEIWWDKSVKTIYKVKKNKPDIVIWNQQDKTCKIVEVSVPLDMNLRQAREDKESKYILLISQLQQMYRGYKYQVIPILTGALGSIPQGLKKNIERNGIQKSRITTVKEQIQKAGILGTVNICKTILNM